MWRSLITKEIELRTIVLDDFKSFVKLGNYMKLLSLEVSSIINVYKGKCKVQLNIVLC